MLIMKGVRKQWESPRGGTAYLKSKNTHMSGITNVFFHIFNQLMKPQTQNSE